MIPYIISQARRGYTMPYVYQEFGVIEEEKMQYLFLDKVCKFILNFFDPLDIDANELVDYFADDAIGSPWKVMIFRNGNWENMTPTFNKIWNQLQIINHNTDCP